MKLTIDTEKLLVLRNYSDREVFFISLLIVLLGYIISDYTDSKKFFYINSRIGNVEVTLDKVVDRINEETIKADKQSHRNIIEPEFRYSSIKKNAPVIYVSKKQFDCLARNIYWEAMHEPLIGQIAVAQVTHNRLLSGKWGKEFCSVVFSKKQFSWTNNEKIRISQPKNKVQWDRAKHSAALFVKGVRVNNLSSSQFYYADYIKKPKWAKSMIKDDKIGTHIFYSSLD